MIKALLIIVLSFCIAIPNVLAATVRETYEHAVDNYNQQKFDDAITLYQDILKEAPNFAPAYVGIGLSLKAKGADSEEVIHYYNEAVAHDPTNLQALEQLGRLYYGLNQFDKAERIFLKCLKINPMQPDIRQALAWVYLIGKSKPELAIRYFKSAGQLNKPDTMYGLGMAYFANNQRVEAMDMMMQLRARGQDDYAKRLEQAIRENRRVVLNGAEGAPVDDDSQPTSTKKSGVKVRLRGKLADL